ncbi:LLM class flavin-dependent oxidoreductase [Goodfellowiella coeruleoviolacea]|uniref:Flavin-dependent oxidoreductase, luciferase family (Includes alkanesulfonate monooxygenase SsuD and methylene tetrahydromethanopterin reductase) n=1 Tax=Goodfellowiella coeruleoviolacea TaxID=334858 RepID=A0AAE3GME0_9PSEU|nr:LLM class flavin-dependent oxidoreductase [Goodfellowiella coeruleoviolacea]MCP2170069.1 Flavin-dependent oxidoreductase, luciferase family (includes alkanesulfonate monooxygenase SsuD and methylene tetrahydromethanopterin reductase) [Goodfellowiella coeruleoviolacea]
MRVGVVVLPETGWAEGARRWRAVEDLGFDSAWTYDHVSWRALRDKAWYSTFPTLTAAACHTSRIRLGTLVTSPNFRHPVLTAKDAIAVDDISDGRFTLGVGSGSTGAGDATVLGGPDLSPRQRADRFAEFTGLLDALLSNDVTDHEGVYFSASDARMLPGCVQRPRLPLAIAAAGRRGFDLVARYGNAWVTQGPADWSRVSSNAECAKLIAEHGARLARACERVGRDPAQLSRIFMPTPVSCPNPVTSVTAFRELAERVAEAGITELVVHWPRADGVYAAPADILERISAQALPALR